MKEGRGDLILALKSMSFLGIKKLFTGKCKEHGISHPPSTVLGANLVLGWLGEQVEVQGEIGKGKGKRGREEDDDAEEEEVEEGKEGWGSHGRGRKTTDDERFRLSLRDCLMQGLKCEGGRQQKKELAKILNSIRQKQPSDQEFGAELLKAQRNVEKADPGGDGVRMATLVGLAVTKGLASVADNSPFLKNISELTHFCSFFAHDFCTNELNVLDKGNTMGSKTGVDKKLVLLSLDHFKLGDYKRTAGNWDSTMNYVNCLVKVTNFMGEMHPFLVDKKEMQKVVERVTIILDEADSRSFDVVRVREDMERRVDEFIRNIGQLIQFWYSNGCMGPAPKFVENALMKTDGKGVSLESYLTTARKVTSAVTEDGLADRWDPHKGGDRSFRQERKDRTGESAQPRDEAARGRTTKDFTEFNGKIHAWTERNWKGFCHFEYTREAGCKFRTQCKKKHAPDEKERKQRRKKALKACGNPPQ
jgi:hypothetical protein